MRRRSREDHVSISAAESERVYAGDTFTVGLRERLERGRHAELRFFKINVRIRCLKMEARRNLPILDHEHCLEQASNARGRFQVTEVGFYRANRKRRVS